MVIEELDFENKKDKMLYGKKKYNQMLSEFAYEKIKNYIVLGMYKDGIETITVNPYMTTKIGAKKY